ncbi:hypothetical protein BJ508DRAFT_303583 [Ascobolus immersus RN42]|uniref:Uncharacterized protein n=1 Tax=Ascobolus immersus RN42 TaxID=1160509 RepID=A0A3N4IGT3_ASCIM|nr:hypothetical protein BJ508DRAFT_303583 [Ascobolus immersus RN42]
MPAVARNRLRASIRKDFLNRSSVPSQDKLVENGVPVVYYPGLEFSGVLAVLSELVPFSLIDHRLLQFMTVLGMCIVQQTPELQDMGSPEKFKLTRSSQRVVVMAPSFPGPVSVFFHTIIRMMNTYGPGMTPNYDSSYLSGIFKSIRKRRLMADKHAIRLDRSSGHDFLLSWPTGTPPDLKPNGHGKTR